MVAEVSPYVFPGLAQATRPTLEEISLEIVGAYLSQHNPTDELTSKEVSPFLFYYNVRTFEGMTTQEKVRLWSEWLEDHEASIAGMKGPRRFRPAVVCRQMFYAIATKHGYTTKKMAGFLNRDHSTAVHARKAHKRDLMYPMYRKLFSIALDRPKMNPKPNEDALLETTIEIVGKKRCNSPELHP